jgi:hypothetical protein
MSNLTWERLVELEPELDDLRAEIEETSDNGVDPFCANAHWYSRFKPRLVSLVGNHASGKDPQLRSHEAYDLAYHKLYDLLPNCSHDEACWSISDGGPEFPPGRRRIEDEE